MRFGKRKGQLNPKAESYVLWEGLAGAGRSHGAGREAGAGRARWALGPLAGLPHAAELPYLGLGVDAVGARLSCGGGRLPRLLTAGAHLGEERNDFISACSHTLTVCTFNNQWNWDLHTTPPSLVHVKHNDLGHQLFLLLQYTNDFPCIYPFVVCLFNIG